MQKDDTYECLKKHGSDDLTFQARDEWIEKQLQLRIDEFSEKKMLRVFIGTWNVSACKPMEDLDPWLIEDPRWKDAKDPKDPMPELYIIGIQEIVDFNAGTLIVDNDAPAISWQDKILRTINESDAEGYFCFKEIHMVGLALFGFCKNSLRGKITDIQTDAVGVGIMGVGGNKGAVAIRCQIYDSSFCFVNCHLAAHANQAAARNNDYHNICKRLFVRRTPQLYSNFDIFQHEYLFWIGDLNYRLNLTDMDIVLLKIQSRDWAFLLAHDQLLLAKGEGLAFKGFQEGTIDFAPTFKYQPHSHNYKRSAKESKTRVPAWCDRVQWIGADCKQLFYCRTELVSSDHKPVSSMFQTQAKEFDKKKKQNLYDSLSSQLDVWSNENVPKVQLSPKSLEFGNVNFDVPVTRTLSVQNIGLVVSYFRFTPKFQTQDKYCKSWLSAHPVAGVIPPNTSQEIDVTIHVTKKNAQALNSGEDTLDDILLLRLDKGRDYFMTVGGDYLKSCNGASVLWLLKVGTPVRFLEAPNNLTDEVLGVPKELWRMVHYIYSGEEGSLGLDTPGLFRKSGQPHETERIVEALDCGTHFPPKMSIHSMADALVNFLSNLMEAPVFPEIICEKLRDGPTTEAQLTAFCKQALTQLSTQCYCAFVYVIAFLKECLKHKSKNGLTDQQLVAVFAWPLMATKQLAMNDDPRFYLGVKTPVWQKQHLVLKNFLTDDSIV